MKTCSIAVALVLTFMCIPRNSAFPFTPEHELEEPMSTDNTAVAHEDTSVDSWREQKKPEATSTDESASAEEEESAETWMLPYDIRQRRYNGPVRCRYCCGCCALGVCGMCCE